jgi:UDP-glucose 4-epimerase
MKEKKAGAYNLAADGTMGFEEMIRIMGNWMLKLPYPFIYIMNNLMWMLRVKFITEFPSPALNMTVYPWIASNGKLKREIGYTFNYTTREAFEDFVRHVKENKASMISRIFSAFAK